MDFLNSNFFIIVGAAKSGTTSLFHYLSEHPEIFMTTPKEVNFFSKDEIKNQNLFYDSHITENISDYENLFRNHTNEKAIGEGSVSYLFYSKTPYKIQELIPNAKILILLREPISRGFSHYLMDYKLGLVNNNYKDIVYKKSTHKNMKLYYQQYVELGLYYSQVKRYLDIFGKEQVKIFLQEDLYNNTDYVIKDIFNFLNVDTSFMPNVDKTHNVFSSPKNKSIHKIYSNYYLRNSLSKIIPTNIKDNIKKIFFKYDSKPMIDKDVKQYLFTIYYDDIIKLELLINRDLSHWKNF